MKVIDLLNKIANGEEMPKKIKYDDDIYIHVDNYCYFCEETNEILSQNIYAEFSRLNDEVEIIEENKPIKTIQTISSKWYSEYIDTYVDEEEKYSVYDEILMNKVNELIDKVNELEDK